MLAQLLIFRQAKLAKRLTAITIGTAASLTLSSAVQAAQVLRGPTDQQFTVSNLPNGNYRFCSDDAPDIDQVSGVCFRFRKQGGDIVGNYYYPYEGSSLCVTGKVNGNTVTGQGLERLQPDASRSEAVPQESGLTDWRQDGFLQVGRAVGERSPDRVRYRSLLMNLNGFYQYNAGAVVPPQSCTLAASPAVPSQPPQGDRQSEIPGRSPEGTQTLRVVGQSEFYGLPIYLDVNSVRQVEQRFYQYRILIGVDRRRAESELLVNCADLDQVRLYRTRYYDDAGNISEVEEVNQLQTVTSDRNPSKYNANQLICRESEVGRRIPRDVTYERYVNERFNYSVRYPNNIVTPGNIPTNADGRVFRSDDGDVTMRVYGTNNSLSQTLEARYQQAQTENPELDITYQTIGDDFFVISGYMADRAVYRKTRLSNGVFQVLDITYNRVLRPEFDPVVAEIASSFQSLE